MRHSLGLKAPRGWGWLTNPRKAMYNRIYNRTTFGIGDLFNAVFRGRASTGCVFSLFVLIVILGVIYIGWIMMTKQ